MFYLGLILAKTFGLLLSLLPRSLFLRLGKALGWILLRCGFRKEIAEENLRLAFPFLDANQRQKFLSENYAEMGILFLELMGSFFGFRRFLENYCDIQNEHYLQEALQGGKGVFVMSAHLGNWEVATGAGAALLGAPVTMVTKELKPRWFHRMVVVTRSLLGVTMASEPKTMAPIMRALKKNQIVGFVMDQYAGAPVGARVPFFGIPVGSHTALAALALRTGVPVLPAIAVRKPDGRYLLRFDPVLETIPHPDPKEAVLLNTAQYVKHTEGWIKEFPLQWMWVHRRWKGDLSPLPPHAVGEMLK